MGIIYQSSIKENPTSELDWDDCTEDVYNQLEGYNIAIRIIKREVKKNDWDKLWDDFTMTPEYKQSIEALRIRAFYDWLRDNFNTPERK
jgi:hypothetical protein